MAVRFLPAPQEESAAQAPERSNLAEVIELRSLLQQRAWGPSASSTETEEDQEPSPVDQRVVYVAPHDNADDASSSQGSDVTEDAVRLLARRAKSSGELRDELLKLGHGISDVETVIDEFEKNLYLDDAGLARIVTEKLRTTKRASRSQIRVKLKERRFADSVVEYALGELDEEGEFALLRSTAEDRARRMQGLDRVVAERRLLGFLARRGWSGEPASRAVREALDQLGGESSGVRFR